MRAWYRLAAHLGKSVAETMRDVDSVEFTHWRVLDQQEPFDSVKYYLAQLASLLVNIHTGDTTTIGDFLLFKEAADEETTKERVAKSVVDAFSAIAQVWQRNEQQGGQGTCPR